MTQLHPVQEGLFLITSVTRDRQSIFQNAAYARQAVETLYHVQERHPFFLYAFVIMPDHCHFLLSIPANGSISKVMNVYKGILSADIGIGPLWQRRFHVRINPDIPVVRRYIHLNPVRAGLVENPEDYSWSSASGKWDVIHDEI